MSDSSPASSSVTESTDRGTCRIEGPLVIASVASWHQQLVERLASVRELRLDLAGLTAIDAFGLQLLWSARETAAARQQALTFSHAGAVVDDACTAAGFNSALFHAP